MAKHNDAGRNLHWLEEELLAEEYDEYEEDEEYEDGEDWEEDGEEEDEPEAEPDYRRLPRNRSAGFRRVVYEEQEFDEDAAVLAPAPKKGIFKLLLVLLLELAAIAAIVRWWIQWL